MRPARCWPAARSICAIAMGATGIVGDAGARRSRSWRRSSARAGTWSSRDGVWVRGSGPADGLAAFGMAARRARRGRRRASPALGRAAGLEPVVGRARVDRASGTTYEAAYAGGDRATGRPRTPTIRSATPSLARAAGIRESYAAWRRAAMGFAIGRVPGAGAAEARRGDPGARRALRGTSARRRQALIDRDDDLARAAPAAAARRRRRPAASSSARASSR